MSSAMTGLSVGMVVCKYLFPALVAATRAGGSRLCCWVLGSGFWVLGSVHPPWPSCSTEVSTSSFFRQPGIKTLAGDRPVIHTGIRSSCINDEKRRACSLSDIAPSPRSGSPPPPASSPPSRYRRTAPRYQKPSHHEGARRDWQPGGDVRICV